MRVIFEKYQQNVKKVNTHPPNHAKKAVHVKATWGKYVMKVVVVTNADICTLLPLDNVTPNIKMKRKTN